ncbi:LysE family translocator [Acidihalobacter ferrooxydans]|uniref:Lysine transporter LysE n=1 Tax=Acidihalobacter ferrooxydans TaxID=1765967 RepID=A0A1P8UJR1_9GAMM|nr:LysE family translocator [Acidihalobacter ferrooxydans]APZ44034.1 lysine transporter LysE [Acidihalobacter ferrooxydans]
MDNLEMFVGALVVVYLIPGPDMILLLETSAVGGRAVALATAVGLGIARATQVALAGVGLAALFKASPWVFDAVRFCGAGYLIYLGTRMLRVSTPRLHPAPGVGRPPRVNLFAALRRGLLTNLLNPKALLFCSVLLPQFTHPGHSPMLLQFAVLGAILVGVGFCFDLVYASAGRGLGHLGTHNRTLHLLRNGVFASLLIGFGVRLALSMR